MSDWTERRTWTRVVRGAVRGDDALLRITHQRGGSFCWETVMVDVERPGAGIAPTLREAKAAAYAEWLVMTGRLVRARGGA